MFARYVKGTALLVGMIFGAGVFALPWAFAQAGLFWGTIFFLAALTVVIFSHLMYGEVVYFLEGRRRLTGYVEVLLGRRAKILALLTTVFSYYGSLLIYGILGGIFLSNFLGREFLTPLTLVFLALAGILAALRLSTFASLNVVLTLPLLVFVVLLFATALPHLRPEQFLAGARFDFSGGWFLPFGIWLFALGGYSSLPEVRDLFVRENVRHYKRVILLAFGVIVVSYALFIAGVWGVSGSLTSEDALSGIASALGPRIFLVGSLVGLLAVLTSYLALAEDMRLTFAYDYRLSTLPAWLLTVLPPLGLYSLGIQGFTRTLGVIGTLGTGLLAVFIVLMSRRLRAALHRGGEDILRARPGKGDLLAHAPLYEALVLIGSLAAAAYELWRILR